MKKSFPLFLLSTFVLLCIAVAYYGFFRQRNQTNIYIRVNLIRSANLPSSAPFNWVPYWISDAISVNDTDRNPFGGVNATVIEKNSYFAPLYGRYVFLTFRVRVLKDKSGVYLFKNKPVAIGSLLSFQLPRAQVDGLVTEMDTKILSSEYKKIRLTLKGKTLDDYIAYAAKEGSVIMDDKSQEIAKIIQVRITSSRFRYDSTTGLSNFNLDDTRKDLETVVDVLAKKVSSEYYFSDTQKIKVGEYINLPFPEVTLGLYITEVEPR